MERMSLYRGFELAQTTAEFAAVWVSDSKPVQNTGYGTFPDDVVKHTRAQSLLVETLCLPAHKIETE